MITLKELYRIGYGPSSSHTMGPRKAASQFLERHADAASFEVVLYGSPCATGKGHMTDLAILEVLGRRRTTIIWEPKTFLPFHPNGMTFMAFDDKGNELEEWTVFSVGGGALAEEGVEGTPQEEIYTMDKATDILSWCVNTGKSYWEYVEECEGSGIWDYLEEVWETMKQAVCNGLEHEGVLPGPLCLPRKAAAYRVRAEGYQHSMRTRGLLFAYALAVSEENAGGGKIVTAPTCGSCGVLPAVLYPSVHLTPNQRQTHYPRIGHGRSVWQYRQDQRIHFRRRSGMPGRSGRGLCHGCSGCHTAVRRNTRTNRIRCRNGIGASLGTDMRPGVRHGAIPVHRAQRLCSGTCHGLKLLCHVYRRHSSGIVRQGGGGDEENRTRPAFLI